MSSVVVTGGAGFLGGHLVRRLVERGEEVVVVDDLSTGRAAAVPAGATLVEQDVSRGLDLQVPVSTVFHLASPASPPAYQERSLETLRAGAEGTAEALELARRHDATILVASTSEVYGDPEQHPQPETYRGSVDPVGPRSVYDEAKRFAEARTTAYHRVYGLDTRIARIFNTYGPGMNPRDGRVVPTFVARAIRGEPLPLHGDGTQTRSFCYVSDLVDGLLALAERGDAQPTNLGNPQEVTVRELAHRVLALTGSRSRIEVRPRPGDDPSRRCPDIARARTLLGWRPRVDLDEGLRRTIAHARRAPDGGPSALAPPSPWRELA